MCYTSIFFPLTVDAENILKFCRFLAARLYLHIYERNIRQGILNVKEQANYQKYIKVYISRNSGAQRDKMSLSQNYKGGYQCTIRDNIHITSNGSLNTRKCVCDHHLDTPAESSGNTHRLCACRKYIGVSTPTILWFLKLFKVLASSKSRQENFTFKIYFFFNFNYLVLFVWCFTAHLRIFHSYGDVTITGEGL